MPIPGKRRSRSKKRRGWAHRAIPALVLTRCSNCGKPTVPHQACRFCGSYRGRQVIAAKVKAAKPRKGQSTEAAPAKG
ncbi:MAG: large subunit ribosomal protein L32 [Parcubacteria group bacterium Gr01-1014_31]|nr:MAG: large subunit ribosomal protein L32 [Parcubacteria group bacterium Gr01-1014_31]